MTLWLSLGVGMAVILSIYHDACKFAVYTANCYRVHYILHGFELQSVGEYVTLGSMERCAETEAQ